MKKHVFFVDPRKMKANTEYFRITKVSGGKAAAIKKALEDCAQEYYCAAIHDTNAVAEFRDNRNRRITEKGCVVVHTFGKPYPNGVSPTDATPVYYVYG